MNDAPNDDGNDTPVPDDDVSRYAEKKRNDFALIMATVLMGQGNAGMSNEEKDDFVAKIIGKVKT